MYNTKLFTRGFRPLQYGFIQRSVVSVMHIEMKKKKPCLSVFKMKNFLFLLRKVNCPWIPYCLSQKGIGIFLAAEDEKINILAANSWFINSTQMMITEYLIKLCEEMLGWKFESYWKKNKQPTKQNQNQNCLIWDWEWKVFGGATTENEAPVKQLIPVSWDGHSTTVYPGQMEGGWNEQSGM